MLRKQRTPLPLPERKALAIAARDALDAVIHQLHQASSGWESAAESSALGARQAMEAVSLLKSANRERDALAAANLAANKRIVELEHERDAARAELARLTTPRPIAEAPRDGTWVLCKSSAGWKEGQFCGLNFDPPNCLGWFGRDNRELRRVTDYLPLPEVKP